MDDAAAGDRLDQQVQRQAEHWRAEEARHAQLSKHHAAEQRRARLTAGGFEAALAVLSLGAVKEPDSPASELSDEPSTSQPAPNPATDKLSPAGDVKVPDAACESAEAATGAEAKANQPAGDLIARQPTKHARRWAEAA